VTLSCDIAYAVSRGRVTRDGRDTQPLNERDQADHRDDADLDFRDALEAAGLRE
jgi:hypothetical protein